MFENIAKRGERICGEIGFLDKCEATKRLDQEKKSSRNDGVVQIVFLFQKHSACNSYEHTNYEGGMGRSSLILVTPYIL